MSNRPSLLVAWSRKGTHARWHESKLSLESPYVRGVKKNHQDENAVDRVLHFVAVLLHRSCLEPAAHLSENSEEFACVSHLEYM